MRGAMTLLPQYAFIAWHSVKAQKQLYLDLLPTIKKLPHGNMEAEYLSPNPQT
jgi:hypothetical protein